MPGREPPPGLLDRGGEIRVVLAGGLHEALEPAVVEFRPDVETRREWRSARRSSSFQAMAFSLDSDATAMR